MVVAVERFAGGHRSIVVGWLATCAGLILTTLVIGQIETFTHPQTVSVLYILVILGSAIAFGPYQSIFAALASVVMYDYEFVDPRGSLDPGDAESWLEVLLFLVVAIVSSQLASQQRRRTGEARRREREATALYTLNSLIVWGDEPSVFVTNVFRAFAADLFLEGLVLYVPNAVGELVEQAREGGRAASAEEHERASQEFRAASTAVDARGPIQAGPRAIPRRRLRPIASRPAGEIAEVSFVPILVESRPVGVLEVIRRSEPQDLTETQRRFLEVIRQQFGIALERARLRREAAEAAALRRSEEVKSAVLHSVTHDLRTPLAMIKASAGNLRQREVDWTDDERDGFAMSIERNVDRLDVIVGNLLDLSRIDAGMIHPERQYYPLGALLDDVLGRLGLLLADFPVTVALPEGLPPVPIDYVAIDRVLSNLLENVTRHTPPGTQITISASEVEREMIVSVADNGTGIPATQVPFVFDRFYRGQPSRPDAYRGTGLGLAVVKGLVEAHGGVVRLTSKPGVGSTVVFTLPLGKVRDPELDLEPDLAGSLR